MGHYAKVVNGKVTQVIAAQADFFDTFIDNEPGKWVKTSYNTRGGIHYNSETIEPSVDQSKSLRKNFAGIGFTYDSERDAFYATKPYNSWILNESTCIWEAPVAMPTDDNYYTWNEEDQAWEIVDD